MHLADTTVLPDHNRKQGRAVREGPQHRVGEGEAAQAATGGPAENGPVVATERREAAKLAATTR